MTRDDAKKLIRKLLQRAKGGGVEAVRARERAHVLMERHGIEMQLVTDWEVPVPGVVGSYWRSLLLMNAASAKSCKVVERPGRGGYVAYVIGERDAVQKTVELYRLGELRIASKAARWWGTAQYQLPVDALGVPIFSRSTVLRSDPEIGRIFFQLIAVSAAESFISPSKQKAQTAYEAPPPGVMRAPPPIVVREGDLLSAGLKRVAAIVGVTCAQMLAAKAVDLGGTVARDLVAVAYAPALRLAADSEAFEARPPIDALVGRPGHGVVVPLCECGCECIRHAVIGRLTTGHCRDCGCSHYRPRPQAAPPPTPAAQSPAPKIEPVQQPEPEPLHSRWSLIEVD